MSDINEAEIKLGLEAEAFIESNLGRLIQGKADQDCEAAKDKLLDLDPYQYSSLPELQNAIMTIQADAKTALRIKSYIAETIITGKQADQPEEN